MGLLLALALLTTALPPCLAAASTDAQKPLAENDALSAQTEGPVGDDVGAPHGEAEPLVIDERFNPFGGWEIHELANGMRVWIKAWPGAEEVRASLSLPVGADHDPKGLEGLAHYLEHVLFTSVPGQTEAEFKKAVSDRGGTYNGTTGSVSTWYWNQLPVAEWRFGIQWLHDTVFGKEFEAENIRKQLAPILLEGGSQVQPKGFAEFMDSLAKPHWTRLPSWPEREFGLKRDGRSNIGSWESLHKIEPEHVREFYERHYHPNVMRLVVVGDVEPAQTLTYIRELFEAYPRGNDPPTYRRKAQGPERKITAYKWSDRHDAEYKLSFRLHDLSADDYVRAYLFGNLMRLRLTRKLRWGEEKSSYSISLKSSAVYGSRKITLSTNCASERLEDVRQAFADVLQEFKEPSDPVAFDEVRDELIAQLRRSNPTPGALVKNWVETEPLVHPDVFPSMPDVLGLTESLGPPELATWLSRHVRPERMTESIRRPSPIPEAMMVPVVFLSFWIALVVLRRWLVRPVDLRRLRYVRKLRYPPLQWLIGITAWVLALSAIAAMAMFIEARAELLVEHIPSFAVHYSWSTMLEFLHIVAFVLLGTLIPRKVLLFEDQLLLKFWSWRSIRARYDAVDEMRVISLWGLWRDGCWLTMPLSAYLWKPGVYLRHGRFGVLLHTRKPEELAAAVQEGIDRCSPPPCASERSTPLEGVGSPDSEPGAGPLLPDNSSRVG
ncbi:MAG TPA: hypothetical protein DIU15_13045 [Deltaproteobacteria bacterium]|nr:hypothetical protein [Deltaproteobacteria bacterium]